MGPCPTGDVSIGIKCAPGVVGPAEADLDFDILRNDNDTFTVKYTPRGAGLHTIMVLFADQVGGAGGGHRRGGSLQILGGPFRSLWVPSDPWGSLQIHETLRGQGEALGGWERHLGGRGSSSDPWVSLQSPGGPLRSLGVPSDPCGA